MTFMSTRKKVLVYECISGGGLPGAGAGAPDPGLLAQGLAMRDALAADLHRLDDVAVSCVASRHAALPALLAAVRCIHAGVGHEAGHEAAAAAAFLAREARHHDRVWVIAPESGDLLERLAACVGTERWIGCTTPAIRVAASKSATRQRLAAAGIAVPASWRPGEPEPPGEPKPTGEPDAADGTCWIVKPDDGAGSVDAQLHVDFATARHDLLARLDRGVASTLEAWIGGIPLSLSLLCRDGRAELLAINHQRIVAAVGSAVVYRGVDICALPVDGPAGRRLAALAQQIAAAVPGLAGYVGVDVVWRAPSPPSPFSQAARPGRPVVIEINPRVTCAYVGLSAALGRNLAGEILQAHDAEPLKHGLH
jgi:tyramine---L-glutamate ligase